MNSSSTSKSPTASSGQTIRLVASPSDQKSSSLTTSITIVFAILALSASILSILIFFNIIEFGEEQLTGYCPSDNCDINANNFTGAILSTDELKGVNNLVVTSKFTTNSLISNNITISRADISSVNGVINFNQGFTVENGNNTIISAENHITNNLSASTISVTNVSFTKINSENIIMNVSTINSNRCTAIDNEIVNITFTNLSSSIIKSTGLLSTTNLTCTNLVYSENKPIIQNLKTDLIKNDNLFIGTSSTISNFYTNDNIEVSNFTLTSSNQRSLTVNSINGKSLNNLGSIYIYNITTTQIQGDFIACDNLSAKNISMSSFFTDVIDINNGKFNDITATNISISKKINGSLSIVQDLSATNVYCKNINNLKTIVGTPDIIAQGVLYNDISVINNMNTSYILYSNAYYNTSGKINLFGINVDLVDNKINTSTYKTINTVFVNGTYDNTNDINLNISFTNINSKNIGFEASSLVGTSFQIYINKDLVDPLKNNVYIKINNLLPATLSFVGLGNPIIIESNKSSKFLIKSQENIISWYNYSCIEYNNNVLTYFNSVK